MSYGGHPGSAGYGPPPGSIPTQQYGGAPGGYAQQGYGAPAGYPAQQPGYGAAPAHGYTTPSTQPYGQPAYGQPQQQYAAPAAYGAPQQPYGAPAPYGATAPAPYGAPQQQYGAPAPYGAPQQQHGAPALYGQPAQHFGSQVVVVDQRFVTPVETFVIIQEKKMSFSGNDAVVTTLQRVPLFSFVASAMSLREYRELKDTSGHIIASMKKELMVRHETWDICRGQGAKHSSQDLLFKVVKHGETCNVYLRGNDNHFGSASADYAVRVQSRGKDFQIYKGQQPIAEVSHKGGAMSSMASADTYGAKIFAGVDQAFVVLVAAAVDEIFVDQGGH